QAARARRARDRARATAVHAIDAAAEEAARAIEDAETRVRAAADQAEAALRDAAADRARAREAEARAGDRTLRPAEVARLRADGPSGPAVLGAALRSLAGARASGDRAGLVRALGDVAAAAVRWRDRL
ncbi:MAG TPA: hypothetical protein VF533_12760, partial [Solirubrobacteraceae bacterium]